MSTHCRTQRARFAQEASERKIAAIEKELEALCARKTFMSGNDLDKEIQKLAVELKKERQALKRKIQNAENQKKFRDNKKMKLNLLCNENPELKRKLALRDAVGRPSLHQDQPELMKAIADIAMNGSATYSNYGGVIKCKRTLEELTTELNRLGFNISRSATYLRLLPRNASTTEAARHVNTLPVTLSPLQDSRFHPDGQFAAVSIRYLETIATILGPLQTLFLLQYDKARVPLIEAACNEQAPLLLHMDYRTKLPDRDWMDSERRKLIPSVYAGIVIENGKIGQLESLTSSGPTYIAIRSGQHSPTAYMHAKDLEYVLDLGEFRQLAKTNSGSIKPVMIIIVEGGPDESPRYEKVMSAAVKIFKENDLDGFFMATNAPDVKYHRIERKIAPLSREAGGLIIPHDHFLGSLLDMQAAEKVDAHKSTFEAAGKILAEVWSSMTLDGHPVRASYLEQHGVEEIIEHPDGDWWARHVRESQYMLQITKCVERSCCNRPRSGLFQILRDRFLPPPLKILQAECELEISNNGDFVDLLPRLLLEVTEKLPCQVPYDFACPSVKSLLLSRTCNSCGLYHASAKSLFHHKKSVHPDTRIKLTPLIIPTQVCANRGNEILCILSNQDGYYDAEWRGNDEVDKSAQFEEDSLKPVENQQLNEVNSWLQSAQAESV